MFIDVKNVYVRKVNQVREKVGRRGDGREKQERGQRKRNREREDREKRERERELSLIHI